ncbi:MAG: hypothetical protein ACLSCO_14815 [Gallintestinimicrobium sp.]
MNQEIYLGGRRIAADAPVFIVAEMSANHLQDYDRAIEIIHAAKKPARTRSSCRPTLQTP